jgi:hypothetical protein
MLISPGQETLKSRAAEMGGQTIGLDSALVEVRFDRYVGAVGP